MYVSYSLIRSATSSVIATESPRRKHYGLALVAALVVMLTVIISWLNIRLLSLVTLQVEIDSLQNSEEYAQLEEWLNLRYVFLSPFRRRMSFRHSYDLLAALDLFKPAAIG